MQLTWQSEPPAVPGWYWHEDAYIRCVSPRYIYKRSELPDCYVRDDNGGYAPDKPVCEWRGRWAGPIPEPTEKV